MKELNFLRRRALSFRSGFRLKNTALAMFFLAVAGLSSCHDREFCGDPQPANLCTTFATVEEDACRNGALGTHWLRLDNGDLLMPQSMDGKAPTLQHGQRIKIGYTVIQTEPAYAFQCNYITTPEYPDLAIQITCLEPIFLCGTEPGTGSENCNTFVTAEKVICGGGVWTNTWLKLDNGEFLQPWENNSGVTNLVAGQRYKIGYEKMARDNRHQNQIICQAMPPAADAIRINCLEAQSDSGTTLK